MKLREREREREREMVNEETFVADNE